MLPTNVSWFETKSWKFLQWHCALCSLVAISVPPCLEAPLTLWLPSGLNLLPEKVFSLWVFSAKIPSLSGSSLSWHSLPSAMGHVVFCDPCGCILVIVREGQQHQCAVVGFRSLYIAALLHVALWLVDVAVVTMVLCTFAILIVLWSYISCHFLSFLSLGVPMHCVDFQGSGVSCRIWNGNVMVQTVVVEAETSVLFEVICMWNKIDTVSRILTSPI